MSWLAGSWAETAPVADVYERAIITLLAHRADDDGCGCWPSVTTQASYAVCDERSVQRRLRALEKRGLIGPGDQNLVAKYDPRHRPKVWDLLIPYDWYSEQQLVEVQRKRAERGDPPLTPESRPPIPPPPPKKRREDVGRARPKRTT